MAPSVATNGDARQSDWPLWTDDKGTNIHERLRALRVEEFHVLAQDDANIESAIISEASHYFRRCKTEFRRYLVFVFETWSGLAIIVTFGGISIFDLGSMLVYAVGGTIVLFFVLIFCLLFTTRPVRIAYRWWSKQYGGDYGLVNSANPRVFQTLTIDQFNAATEALSLPIDKTNSEKYPRRGREFNLDIAKLLIRLAAVVYEYENEPLRDLISKKDKVAPKPMKMMPTSVAAAEVKVSSWWSNMKYWFTVPGDAHKYLELTTAECAKPEQDETPTLKAFSEQHGEDEGARKIHAFCKRFSKFDPAGNEVYTGLEYETISHLGDTSSAVAGLFWKPGENWMVVVFKGTSPLEYGEWLSNLNTKFAPTGSYINGFKRVHKGFKERVFPEDASRIKLDYGSTPYDTIALAIQTLAKELSSKLPDDERFQGQPPEKKKRINVWFTGHSLGYATAQLVYSKVLNDRGKHVSLRDGYMFAAPIVTDRESADAFNAKMMDEVRHPRTMWRITSGQDFVATCLPELGDFRDLVVSPNNAFAFAHLGTEIRLRDGPLMSQATGNHLPWGSTIRIVSKYKPKELLEQYRTALLKKNTRRIPRGDAKYPQGLEYQGRDGDEIDRAETTRIWFGSLWQQIPFFVGRLIAHTTVNYIDQIDRLAIGECEWTTNFNWPNVFVPSHFSSAVFTLTSVV